MRQDHHRFVAERYGERAAEYLESRVHAVGEDLDQIEAAVRGCAASSLLDLGCGGGHVTYRAAPHVREVVAVDLAAEMLGIVRDTAARLRLGRVEVRQGAAERLPFDDRRFDFVVSRFSAHHWLDLDAGLREAARVLAPGGRAFFVDSVAPYSDLLDTYLQTIEVMRDATHVRNRTAAAWVAALQRAGFDVSSMTPRRIRIEFDSWLRRTRTPDLHARAIRSVLENAPTAVRKQLAVATDGSFVLDTITFEAARSTGTQVS